MKINLMKSIFDKIEELGGKDSKEAQDFFGKSANVLDKWSNGSAIPDVDAAQRILDDVLLKLNVPEMIRDTEGNPFGNPKQGKTRPDPIGKRTKDAGTTEGDETEKQTPIDKEPPKPEKKEPIKNVQFLVPTNRDFSHVVVLSLLANWKAALPKEIRAQLPSLDIEHDTVIHHARNTLASRFLKTKAEWSFWMDSDIIAPIGNPPWYEWRTGLKVPPQLNFAALERLTTRGKTLIGGAYVERNKNGRLLAQPGLSPANKKDSDKANEVKKGFQDKIIEVGWIGFGCVAVHRKVFEDILEKVPGVKAKDENGIHGFFTAFETGPTGEDVAFCKRAAQAGHKTYLDLSVICGHVGRHCFIP